MGDIYTALFYLLLLAVIILCIAGLSILPDHFPRINEIVDGILDHVIVSEAIEEDEDEKGFPNIFDKKA